MGNDKVAPDDITKFLRGMAPPDQWAKLGVDDKPKVAAKEPKEPTIPALSMDQINANPK